jgi:hypothetical protein
VSFFTIEPETSGAPFSGSPQEPPVYRFDTWLGDDMVHAFPAVLVTAPLKKALLGLAGLSGCDIVEARVATSPFFRKHSPGKRLPRFWSVKVWGQPGRDDMGLKAGSVLVVSRRVLDVLLDFQIGRAVLAQYAPGRSARPRSAP